MDDFAFLELHGEISEETIEWLQALVDDLSEMGQRMLESIRLVFGYDFFRELAQEIDSIFTPPRKPIRPSKQISHPRNILFDKRVRIYRCRNNC